MTGWPWSFPGQPAVGNEATCQPQLRVGSQHDPGPAVHLLRRAHPCTVPAQPLFAEPQGVLDIESMHVCSPEQLGIWWSRTCVPQPQRFERTCLIGRAIEGDAYHPADRQGLGWSAPAAESLPWTMRHTAVQPTPAADLDTSACSVLLLQPHVRVAPGCLIATAEGGAVAPWPTTMALTTRGRLRRPEEHPIIPEAHQHSGAHIRQATVSSAGL